MQSSEPVSLAVEFDQVSKWFGNLQVLKKVSLRVNSGERVVICGPSGSGKSTLIRCINRLEQHDEGEIRVNGTLLNDNSASSKVRGDVGMVFQSFNLFPHLTVLENCTLGLVRSHKMPHDAAQAQAMDYLQRVKIPEQAHKHPAQLSGGQQQRVAIARALCLEPKIMLFDEPTSALDPEMVREVLDVMVELGRSGMTMLCVTHEMGFAREIADQVVFMDNGEIVEQGSPAQIFETPTTDRLKTFLAQIIH